MRLMVTLGHSGAAAQSHGGGAQSSGRSEGLYLLMLTAAGNVKKPRYDSKRRHTQRGKERPSVWKSAVIIRASVFTSSLIAVGLQRSRVRRSQGSLRKVNRTGGGGRKRTPSGNGLKGVVIPVGPHFPPTQRPFGSPSPIRGARHQAAVDFRPIFSKPVTVTHDVLSRGHV